MPFVSDPPPPLARIVLLVGPSGCGKTHLARQAGLPIVPLDDFYRDGTEPGLPRGLAGAVDWEDPGSWNDVAALDALRTICTESAVEVPIYTFGEDRATGSHVVDRGTSPIVVAEGIFAAELVGPLRDAGLLADALLIHQPRWVTFGRRLLRDLRDGRKSPWYLIRLGWAKTRDEPAVVARQLALGARPVSKAAARRRLAELAGVPEPAPRAAALPRLVDPA